jgi:hypothetical protein
VSVKISTVFRITGSAAELDGFVRSFELVDEGPEIVSIRYHGNTLARISEVHPRAVDQISLDLQFGGPLSADLTYDLVMGHFLNSQRTGSDMTIEPVDDHAEAAG